MLVVHSRQITFAKFNKSRHTAIHSLSIDHIAHW